MQIHLGPGTARTHIDPLPEDDDALLAAVEDGTYWDTEGRWDGWERAGGESFLRRGYASREAYEAGEEPVLIEKSGNPRKTCLRGTRLARAGADIVPTVMVVDDAATERIQGGDYRIFQAWTPEPFAGAYENRVTERQGERSSPLNMAYGDREEAGVLTNQGVESFGRTCAAIDAEGFRIRRGENMIKEFLTDGDRCYAVDFGADLGIWGEPHTQMYDAAQDFLTAADRERFDRAYEQMREA